MPTLHRLATLRDDVIFFVYLYQSWKYKVDYTRVNEFGQGGDDDVAVAVEGDGEQKKIEGKAVEEKDTSVKVDEIMGKASGSEKKKSGATKRK